MAVDLEKYRKLLLAEKTHLQQDKARLRVTGDE